MSRMVGYKGKVEPLSFWADGYTVRKSMREGEPSQELITRELAVRIGATFIANGYGFTAAVSLMDENTELNKQLHNIMDEMEALKSKLKNITNQ